MLLRVNIVIWDRRHIGRVGAHHKQLYLCTPGGQTFIKNVTDTAIMIQQSEYETVHILYDDLRKHYEYFARETSSERNRERPGQNCRKVTGAHNKAKDVKGTTTGDIQRQATRVIEAETDKAGMK
eukprot:5923820-Pleurochrysis_carterae.AAC.1